MLIFALKVIFELHYNVFNLFHLYLPNLFHYSEDKNYHNHLAFKQASYCFAFVLFKVLKPILIHSVEIKTEVIIRTQTISSFSPMDIFENIKK